jgi:F0F1-type ATP synthase assembly protein I
MVVAMHMVHQVTTVALEMALPAGAGAWADQHFDTSPWLLVGGAILGFCAAMSHLLQMAKRSQERHRKKD